MPHTSISAYANRNGILARLVASFLLSFTTSGDVVCLKFGEVWETLWIFKVVKWTRNRWPKINKSPTVSNDVGASSFEIWTANLAQSLTVGTLTNSWSFIFWDSNWKFYKVGYPHRPPKTWHSDADISDLGCFFECFYFLVKKIKNLLYIQEHCIRKLGKIWSELKLLFGVYYLFLKLYTGIIWHSYFPSHGISQWKGRGWSGAKYYHSTISSPSTFLLIHSSLSWNDLCSCQDIKIQFLTSCTRTYPSFSINKSQTMASSTLRFQMLQFSV